MVIIRKNILYVTASFVAEDGSGTQPSSANMILFYTDQTGATHDVSVALTSVTDPTTAAVTWTGQWDTSASAAGTVFWMIYGYGSLQAAAEGEFQVVANAANTI